LSGLTASLIGHVSQVLPDLLAYLGGESFLGQATWSFVLDHGMAVDCVLSQAAFL
jgi:hypothetical protein